jgi:hypothetical protein
MLQVVVVTAAVTMMVQRTVLTGTQYGINRSTRINSSSRRSRWGHT